MRIFRTLFAKILGWFWLTFMVGSLLILLVAACTGTQPLGRRWMRLTQGLYAQAAVDLYEAGDEPALANFLNSLRDSSGMHATLLDSAQHDLLGNVLPPHAYQVFRRSIDTGEQTVQTGRIWTAATPVRHGQRQYYFVIEIHPLRALFNGQIFSIQLLWRLALFLLVAAVFCVALARHIVAPIHALRAAALRLSAGDLSSRVAPSIAHREDELADMAGAFDQMADRLELLINKRQELLADISHELRSPLTRLSVSLELMRRGETDVIEKMETDLNRMNIMISQILLLRKLDLQPLPSSIVEVALEQMIRSIASDAEYEGRHHGKTVRLRMQAGCSVRGDESLLRSCIENIVRNAVHYTGPHTAVEIHARRITDPLGRVSCEILVLDCGPGVPEDSLPLLFDPFYRVSESRDLREGGTGLGLSIAQKIVDLHHGVIHAANRKDGNGLEIRLQLPST